MKWPWSTRLQEARAAADEARQELERSRARRAQVEREAARIRHQREANHLTQLFDQIISGRG